jgi:hypothetical protein
MKTLNKQEFLEALQEQVESHLTQAAHVFQNLDEQVLNQRPEGGGWSISECLEHLNTYSRYYLPRLEEGLLKAGQSDTISFKSSWLGDYFQKMMDPDRGSKKHKAACRHLPAIAKSGYGVVAEFIDFQERLCKVLIGYRVLDLNAVKIPTSLTSLIRLNAGDTIAFLITHDERHIRQANRILCLSPSTTATVKRR